MTQKKLFVLGMLLIFVLALTGCGGTNTDAFKLTVTAEHGTVTKAPDKATYAKGDQVALTAVPAEGYTFDHWEGSGFNGKTDSPLTVVMTADVAIKAVFKVVELTTGTIEGYVTNLSDLPVAGVVVTAYIDDAHYWSATTDASGYYQITGLEPQTYVIYAMADDYDLFESPLDVQAGLNTYSITLEGTGPQLGSVTGTVTDDLGNPLVGTPVYIYSKHYSEDTAAVYVTVDTNATGKYEFADLKVADYTILVENDGNIYSSTVEIANGETRTHDISVSSQIKTEVYSESINVDEPEYEFSFTIVEPSIYEIITVESSGECDTIIYFYDVNDNLVAFNDDSYNKPYSFLQLDLPVGDYRIVVVNKAEGEPLTFMLKLNTVEY